MREIEDFRRKSSYELAAVITASIAMFIFKSGSRNALNNQRQEKHFKKNYVKLFKLDLPHPDTVDRVMRMLPPECLEKLKHKMVQTLLNKKAFHKYRFQNSCFVVAIDGSGVMSFSEQHCEHCLHKTSQKGKTTYFHNVLEAKLITPNGFAISLATEWIENPSGEYDKQDCERKAFARLSAKIKKDYPRLPICLTADGLYPYKGFFDICSNYGWAFIVTFKEGNLPSVWEEIHALQPLVPEHYRKQSIEQPGGQKVEQIYRWVNEIDYQGHKLNWIECFETKSSEKKGSISQRFVHLSSSKVDYHSAPAISETGRLRWKIENEGFNTQKNHGYNLQHKYSRTNWQAGKNYYQCLQIGHLINQLLVLSISFQVHVTGKMTIVHLWKRLLGTLMFGEVDEQVLSSLTKTRIQVRFVL